MAQIRFIPWITIAASALTGMGGCSFRPATFAVIGPHSLPTANVVREASHTHGGTADAEIKHALAQLAAEDREAAARQKVCPVSGEPLGSMGPPGKLRIQGQDVFVCCDGCQEAVLAEPDKYLVKLKPPGASHASGGGR